MAWIVFLLGLGLAVAGGAAVALGAPIIDIERGWAEVIAGVVALSGGIVTIALGCVLVRLNGVRRVLSEAVAVGGWREPGFPADVGPPPAADPPLAADSAAALPDAGRGLATPETLHGENGSAFDTGDGASAVTVSSFVDAPVDVLPVSQPGKPTTPRVGFFRRRRLAAQPSDTDVVKTEAGPETTGPSDGAIAVQVFVDDGRLENGTGPGLGEMPDAAVDEVPDSEAASHAPPHASRVSPSITGRYSAGGVSYVLFDDGSIEAETPQGVFKFASFAELKTFIEQQGLGSGSI